MFKLLSCLTLTFLLVGCGSKTTTEEPAQQTETGAAQQPGSREYKSLAKRSSASPLAPPAERATRVAPVTIPSGTSVHVRLAQSLDTASISSGDTFNATLRDPIEVGGKVVVPTGATFTGHITEAKSSGRLRGRAVLALALDSFEVNGRTYKIDTSSVTRESSSHKKRNAGLIAGGAGLGAVIGAIAGGGKGAAIGAGAGAAAGTAGAAATGKKNVDLPAETPLNFSLRSPVTL